MNNDCIFCKIIKKEIPAKVIKENENIIVIQDVIPKAPVHYLVIPKKHVISMQYLEDSDKELAWSIFKMIRDLSKDLPGPKAFNLLSNNGKEAGQSVPHLHIHFISGRNIGKGEF